MQQTLLIIPGFDESTSDEPYQKVIKLLDAL